MLFVEIMNMVFIMPDIEHLADSSIPSILDNNIKTPSTFTTTKEYERYFTLEHRKYDIEAEYFENERTPMHKTHRRLDSVPKLPRDDFHIRYGNESRVHQFLSKNPPKITTWTEDVIRSNSIANNNNDSTLASSTSSSSASSTAKAYSTSFTSTQSESPTVRGPGSLLTPSAGYPDTNVEIHPKTLSVYCK